MYIFFLIFFSGVSSVGCVEKEDLIQLVCTHFGITQSQAKGSSSSNYDKPVGGTDTKEARHSTKLPPLAREAGSKQSAGAYKDVTGKSTEDGKRDMDEKSEERRPAPRSQQGVDAVNMDQKLVAFNMKESILVYVAHYISFTCYLARMMAFLRCLK